MTFVSPLKGMLKSHFITMKRNKCLSLIELFCPTILLLFFLALSTCFSEENKKFEDLFNSTSDFLALYSSNLTNKVQSWKQIISNFSNIDKFTPIQYKQFIYQCEKHPYIALIGKNFPIKLKEDIYSHNWEIKKKDVSKNIIFKEFNTVEDFNNYITDENYGKDEISNPKICFGISKSDDKEYGFGIHYDTINMNSDENIFNIDVPLIPDSKSNKYEKIKVQTDLNSFNITQYSGYLMAMKLIYDYILREMTNTTDAEINFSISEMIFDSIKSDNFHKYLYLLGFFIIISYAIILSINIYREINFRETKKKEYLKSMGVKENVFFFSSFIRHFFLNIIHCLSTALIIKFILKQTQYIYLLIILFFYGLVIFSMTYFFQTFLQEGRKGVILSLLCYSIMGSFVLPIDSPVCNKNIINLFCILFPPVNLILGINTLCIYEKEFNKLEDLSLDIGQITIVEMIAFFICSFIIYLIIGLIISKYFHYDYGISKFCRKKIENKVDQKEPDLISNSEKNSNKTTDLNKDTEELGNEYVEEGREDEFKEIKPSINDQIKLMVNDFMNTPEGTQNYLRKFKNLSIKLKQSFNELSKNDELNNKIIYEDELEKDFNLNKRRQNIRKLRREIGTTMCNLKNEQYFIDKLNINEIQNMFQENTILSNGMENASSEDMNSITEISPNERTNNVKDKINPGQRLEINNLKKYYDKKKVLGNLKFTMYENEIFALLGENGAGKSTFISILGGLIESSGGSIIYKTSNKDEGYDITNHEGNSQFRKILGICAQNNNILFNDLTVKENLEVFCLLKDYNGSRKERENEVISSMKKFDLESKSNFLAKNLSGGQKRKLCIAIACLGKSRVIILDEPTGGVDIASRKNIWNILKKLKLEEKIIILISHSMDEVSFLADKIGILKKGKLICKNTYRELIDKYANYFSLIVNKRIKYEEAEKIANYIKKNYYNYYNEGNSNINDKSDKISELTNSTLISVNDKNIKIEAFKERVIFRISTKYFNKISSAKLLKDLKEKYNINNYLIIEDQLEDLFINTINDNIIASNKTHYMVISGSYDFKTETKKILKFKNQLKLLFFKRLKDKRTYISEILFPIILILIACLVAYIEWLDDNKTGKINLLPLFDEENKLK